MEKYQRKLARLVSRLVRDPGLRFLIPIIDRPVKVDVREQYIEVPSQTTITRDNAPINVDFLIYWKIVDPLRSVLNAQNFPGMLQGVATTTLRAVIGDIALDEVLYAGQVVGLVVATSLRVARAAAAKVKLRIEELPAILNIDAALKAESYVLPPVFTVRGKPDEAIASATHQLSGELTLGVFDANGKVERRTLRVGSNERIARRSADAFANAVGEAHAQHPAPGVGEYPLPAAAQQLHQLVPDR